MNSRVALVFGLTLALATPVSAASLTLLPDWFTSPSMRALWMSPDAKRFTGVDGDSVFRWSASDGRTNLGTLPSTIGSSPIDIATISDDGSTIIGKFGGSGFFWTAEGGTVLLPPIISDQSYLLTFPTALSSDGAIIVGNAHDPFSSYDSHAFRWTAETGFVLLDGLDFAAAVSPDGSVIVGGAYFDRSPWPQSTDSQAVRWTQATGTVGLGIMPNSWQQDSAAEFVSHDGTVVVGYGFPPDARIGPKVFRWTDTEGMQQPSTLGDDQEPIAMSADGNVIIGDMRTLDSNVTTFATIDDFFVWTPDTGLRKLPELIAALGIGNIAPFSDPNQYSELYDISADGRIVFGQSSDPIRGQYWLLDISPVPEPTSSALLACGLALTSIARTRRR
jgi:uncharacterized membrane protein